MASERETGRPVAVGDRAPDFTLPRQNGGEFSLGDLLGKQTVVLYFYPKDNTAGCTAEACDFRDRYAEFLEVGAAVVGVSRDSVRSHARFAERYHLPFPLLSDADGAAHKLYGVPRAWGGLIPGRVTYVIDRRGVVRAVYAAVVPTRHVAEALAAIAAAG